MLKNKISNFKLHIYTRKLEIIKFYKLSVLGRHLKFEKKFIWI